MRKSQIAMEFILMLLIILLITTTLAWVAYYYVTDYSEKRNVNHLQELGYSLQNEVILAYNVEPGYSRTINIPGELDGYAINISGAPDYITINYKGSEMFFRIPESTGAFTAGNNIIRKTSAGQVSIN
jgi:hypothetical protein